MSYNKMFKVSLSTALVAALLVGCQASDKQRAQIKRGGGGGGQQQQQKTEDNTFSQGASGKAVETVPVDQITKIYDEVVQIGKNKEVLATDLEDAEYILSAVIFDTQNTNAAKRMTVVASVDGATVCDRTQQAELVIQPNSRNTTTAPNPNAPRKGTNNDSAANGNGVKNLQVTVCDPSKVKIEKAMNSDKQALVDVLPAAAYLRFNVKDKKMSGDEKSLATFKAGYNSTTQQAAMDVMPGKAGRAENIFALLMNAQQSELKGKSYALKGTSGSINATVRKINDKIISIAFEVIASANANKKNAGNVKNLVFEYKKTERRAEAIPAPTIAVDVNKGATETQPAAEKINIDIPSTAVETGT